MSTKNATQKMRKTNMRIFPIYKKLGWDYLFYYSIDFLFLTQVKNISAADVVLKSSFYELFSIFLQIPANIIIDFLGRKNSLILANFLNCFYIIVLILSRNLPDLIFAEFISSIAFSIKNIAEPSLLNESIPPSKYKSSIFAKINAKGASGHYVLGAISKIIAGYLFLINGYLPMICTLAFLVLVTIMSIFFIEPVEKKNKTKNEINYLKNIAEIKDGFIYVLKSNRLKALILSAGLIATLLNIMLNYNVSLFEDIKISSFYIGIISAVGSAVGSIASRNQEAFHNKLKNKSLITIALMLSSSCLISGICGINAKNNLILLILTVVAVWMFYFCNSMYFTIIDKYLRNFTNKDIDTKIFAAKNLITNSLRFIGGITASFLLNRLETVYCMIILGISFMIIYILMGKYMSSRVGKRPEEYSKEEIKYDELHQ